MSHFVEDALQGSNIVMHLVGTLASQPTTPTEQQPCTLEGHYQKATGKCVLKLRAISAAEDQLHRLQSSILLLFSRATTNLPDDHELLVEQAATTPPGEATPILITISGPPPTEESTPRKGYTAALDVAKEQNHD